MSVGIAVGRHAVLVDTDNSGKTLRAHWNTIYPDRCRADANLGLMHFRCTI
jgi:hypothetical protein